MSMSDFFILLFGIGFVGVLISVIFNKMSLARSFLAVSVLGATGVISMTALKERKTKLEKPVVQESIQNEPQKAQIGDFMVFTRGEVYLVTALDLAGPDDDPTLNITVTRYVPSPSANGVVKDELTMTPPPEKSAHLVKDGSRAYESTAARFARQVIPREAK